MNLEVTVTRDYLSPVLADLAQRRGNIQEIQSRQDSNVVTGFVPLAEIMVGALWLINIFYINCWRNPRDHISTGVDAWRRASQPCTKFEVGSTKMCHQPKWPFLHPEHLFTSTVAGSQPVLLPFFSPPASPAVGQASECQQNLLLPNAGTAEYFWSIPPLLVFCPHST